MSSDPQPVNVSTREVDRWAAYRGLTIVYEGRSQRIDVRAPDISPKGMFIHVAQTFPEGAVLKIQFLLTRSNHTVRARGEVRYTLPGVGVGVEFIEISPEDAEAISEEIRSYLST